VLASGARLIFYQREKVAQGNDFTINNETYYHLLAGEGKGLSPSVPPRTGTTLLTLLPVFMPALRWRFFYPTPKNRDAGGLPFFISMAV